MFQVSYQLIHWLANLQQVKVRSLKIIQCLKLEIGKLETGNLKGEAGNLKVKI